jgi:hypothetical protein
MLAFTVRNQDQVANSEIFRFGPVRGAISVEAKLPGLAASFSNSLQVLTPPPTSLNPPRPSMKLKIDFLRDWQQAGHKKTHSASHRRFTTSVLTQGGPWEKEENCKPVWEELAPYF